MRPSSPARLGLPLCGVLHSSRRAASGFFKVTTSHYVRALAVLFCMSHSCVCRIATTCVHWHARLLILKCERYPDSMSLHTPILCADTVVCVRTLVHARMCAAALAGLIPPCTHPYGVQNQVCAVTCTLSSMYDQAGRPALPLHTLML